MDAADYNYETFDGHVERGEDEVEFGGFMDRLHVGDSAPDAVLTDLGTGGQLRLSQLWRARDVVIEFGSFT